MDGSSNRAYFLHVVRRFYWSSNFLTMSQPKSNKETHNTREVEEWEQEFDEMPFGITIPFNQDMMWGEKEGFEADGREEFKQWLHTTLHHQLQKDRQDWLREEIVKLEGMRERAQFGRETSWEIEHANGHNQTLQTIIDRYQEELNQDKQ